MRNVMLAATSASALISALGFCSPAAAQPAPAPAAREREAGDIVVTGRKREERLQDVPISTSVVTSDQLDQSGIATSDDLLRIVPGALTTPFGAEYASDILIRGQGSGRSETSESATGIYRNGAYIAGGGAGGRTLTRLDLFDVERVEIFRGPQGALFGRNAVGGAINVVSHRPTDERALDMRVDLNELGGHEFRVTANTPLAKGLDLRLGGLIDAQDGGFYENANGRQLDRREYYAGRTSLAIEASPSFDAVILIERFTEDSPSFSAFAYRPPQSRFQRNLNTIPRVKADGWTGNLQMNWKLGFATLTSNTFFRNRDLRRTDDQDAVFTVGSNTNVTALDSTIDRTDTFDFQRWSQELQLVSNSGHNYWWALGAEYVASDEDLLLVQSGANAVVSGNAVRLPDFTTTGKSDDGSAAIFGLLGWRIVPALEATAEARTTWDSKSYVGDTRIKSGPSNGVVRDAIDRTRHFSNTSPAFTLRWTPIPDASGYLRIATAYRAGGFNFDSEAANPATQSFDPEKTISYEAGIKTSWLHQRLTFNLSVFKMITNDIQLINRSSLNDRYVFNAGNARVSGVEADARFFTRFGDGSSLALVAGASVNGSKMKNGQIQNGATFIPLAGLSVPRVRDVTANLFASYRRPFVGKSEIRLSANYTGQWGGFENPQNTEILKNYQIVDVSAGIKLGKWEASIYAQNLANYLYVTEQFSGAEFLNRPRVIGVRLRTTIGGDQ